MTAFGWVLLATLSVLAHAVVPHHHHQVAVCVEDIQHEERTGHHDEGVHEHENEQEGRHSQTTPCEFRLAVVVPSSNGKQLRGSDDGSGSHQHGICLISNDKPDVASCSSAIAWVSPVYLSFFTSYVTAVLGLRAPPVA